ncbi:multiple epidermal growth factor domains protein 11, partial [Biomphalaria glabrata]
MLILFLILCVFLSNVFVSDGCDTNWFGSKCQYQCHCQQQCDTKGNCQGSCEIGWFGYKCHY